MHKDDLNVCGLMSCQRNVVKTSLFIGHLLTAVELNSPRGKKNYEIISDLSLSSPVDNTVDIRINASPAVDIIVNRVFLLRTSISSK
jgi:hypothetical protein